MVLDPDLRIVRGPQVSRLSHLIRSKSHLSHLGVLTPRDAIASLDHVCPSVAFAFFVVGFLDSSPRRSRSPRAAAAGQAQHIGYPAPLSCIPENRSAMAHHDQSIPAITARTRKHVSRDEARVPKNRDSAKP